jgi:hypothetical protein
MIKKFEAPLVWWTFAILLGISIGLNAPFLLLVAATIIHFL